MVENIQLPREPRTGEPLMRSRNGGRWVGPRPSAAVEYAGQAPPGRALGGESR
jgi:hypothetical protein